MANGLDVLFGPTVRLWFQRVHADVDIARLFLILVLQPFLKGRARHAVRTGNALENFTGRSAADQNGEPIRGVKVHADVFDR